MLTRLMLPGCLPSSMVRGMAMNLISHELSYGMKYDSQTTLQHLYLIDSSSIHHRASRHPRCQHLASKLQTGTGSGSDDKMAKGWLQA